jgi:photosystem II stability/assembly factor-like uncharacterized protein
MKYGNLSFLVILFFVSFQAQAQQVPVESLKGMEIRNIGPAGMSGRVTTIDVDLREPNRIFIGTASGGAWKSESGGIYWEPIFDDQPVQSIGALKINQNNPSEIWIGTGEGNPRNSLNAGNGIYKSIDGGRNWIHSGLENTRLIHRIYIHREDPNTVLAGALGSPWGPNKERGVFKTTDGGKSWKKVLYINEETGVADMVVDPINPNKIIVAMWEFGRKPWTFNSGGEGSGIYVSFDGGDTWKKRTSEEGLPKGELGRIGLAIAPSQPNIVYALVEAKKNGLYKSTDGGFKWELVAEKNIGNRPFYYADIFVDPKNENRIYNLHSVVTVSQDGGKTFERLLGYVGFSGVHPDHHALWIHPEDPNYLINGNDGGLYISRDRGANWQFASNLPLAQFYHINYDMSYPYNVMGGMQDNGSWIGPSSAWQRGGIKNHDWQEVYFGDGFDVMMHPTQTHIGYAMSQGGNVGRFDLRTGENYTIKPVHPEGIKLRFNWNAAIAQNPFNDCGVYFGSQFVHRSMDCGNSWEIISPDLTTNDTTKQKQAESGGLTIDNTQAENFTTILAISPSPVEQDVIWAGTDDGNLQLTHDGGKSWTNLSGRLPNFPAGSWIPQIVVSEKNAGEAFIVVNDYRRNNWRPMVYHTKDFGQSFKQIVDEKQVQGHALSIVQDPEAPNLLWLGTDYGLYFTIDGGRNWMKWMNDYPSVSTIDLKIHPREHDLIVGTFGRAAWILDDIRPIRAIAQSKGEILDESFAVFEAPDAYLASYRSIKGTRFIGDAEFVGKNRRYGAMVTTWINPSLEDSLQSKEVKVQVVNSEGDTIRTFWSEVDTGINRIYWNLRHDGIRYPSRSTPKKPERLPSGFTAIPGTYELICTYGDFKSSTDVKVNADPRVDADPSAQQKQETYTAFYAMVERASMAFQSLQDARTSIDLAEKQLTNAPDSIQTRIKKSGKALKKQITELEKHFMLPQGLKGIQRTSENINSYLYRASGYISDSEGGELSQMAQFTINQVQERIDTAATEIKAFLANEWADYQKEIEGLDYSIFKELGDF